MGLIPGSNGLRPHNSQSLKFGQFFASPPDWPHSLHFSFILKCRRALLAWSVTVDGSTIPADIEAVSATWPQAAQLRRSSAKKGGIVGQFRIHWSSALVGSACGFAQFGSRKCFPCAQRADNAHPDPRGSEMTGAACEADRKPNQAI